MAHRVGRGIALLFLDAALEGGEWSAARPGRTLPPGKTRYPFYRRLGGSKGRSGRAENLVPTGIRSRTVQPVVSRYTNWATRPTVVGDSERNLSWLMAEKSRVEFCWISGSFLTSHRLGIFSVVSESPQSAPAATRFLHWKTMWFLFNSAQRDHKNTDVYLTGFRIDVELSLYPCVHRSYHTATGKQVSVSSTFLFHHDFYEHCYKQ